MTVVATNGQSMATDSRTCNGDIVLSDDAEKLTVAKDGSLVGCAGEAAACSLVREWFEGGEDLEAIPKFPQSPDETGASRFKALILRTDGRVEFREACFTPVPIAAPAAIGSGGDLAVGAMLAGKSPGEAVRLVLPRITSCGGKVRSKSIGATRRG
jgi:hypothetical protein